MDDLAGRLIDNANTRSAVFATGSIDHAACAQVDEAH